MYIMMLGLNNQLISRQFIYRSISKYDSMYYLMGDFKGIRWNKSTFDRLTNIDQYVTKT